MDTPGPGLQMRLLIVDDNKVNRYILESLLKLSGYSVVSAENGRQALSLLKQSSFDLVISDILMPEMDGYQLCLSMKMDPVLQHIPVVFYTAAYMDEEDEILARRIGVARFIRKPADADLFIQVIQEVVQEARSMPRQGPPRHCDMESVYKLYSQRLVRRLEEKTAELEAALEARDRAIADMKESEAVLKAVLEDAAALLCRISPRGSILYANENFGKVFGIPCDQVIGANFFLLFPEHEQLEIKERLASLGPDSPVISFENSYFDSIDGVRWFKWIFRGIFSSDGRIKEYQGAGRDITRQKLTEDTLRILDAAISTSPGPMALADPGGKITYVNRAFADLWGYAWESELLGQSILFFLDPDTDPGSVFSIIERKKEFSGELAGHAKDGKQVIVWSVLTLVEGDDGRQLCIIGSFFDLSRQRALERRIRQAQKTETMAVMAGGIAHDFNNVLSSIMGYAELARKSSEPGSKTFSHIEAVLAASRRARELVKQILTFARQSEQEKRPVKINPLVKETMKLLRSAIPSDIKIRTRIDSPSRVLADPTQIHQLLMNLCTNAVKAMYDKGGILFVGVSDVNFDEEFCKTRSVLVPGNYVKLVVSDTGCGMAPDIMDRVFDPYFTTRQAGEGTGLGLFVANNIARSHGGLMEVESSPGTGSRFTVFIPTYEGDEKKQLPEIPETLDGNESILFVDDDPSIVEMACELMEFHGYKVTPSTGSNDALSRFSADPFAYDIVITDMTMPDMTGDRLAVEIMRIRPDIPVILCTGYHRKIDEKKAERLGISAFVMKPLTDEELLGTIRKVLDRN